MTITIPLWLIFFILGFVTAILLMSIFAIRSRKKFDKLMEDVKKDFTVEESDDVDKRY